MKLEKLREILKKEYVKTAILLGIVVVCVVTFWYGITAALGTPYPLLAVASESMEPVLYKGDLIMVQGVSNVSDIVVGRSDANPPGDIIVFHRPGDPSELIVHRAIRREGDGLVTRGDHNPSEDKWRVSEDDLVGKVVGHVPYLGHIPLFLREFLWTPIGIAMIVALLLIFLFYDYIPFPGKKDKEEEKK